MFFFKTIGVNYTRQLLSISFFETKIRYALKIFKNQGYLFCFAYKNAVHCIGKQTKINSFFKVPCTDLQCSDSETIYSKAI